MHLLYIVHIQYYMLIFKAEDFEVHEQCCHFAISNELVKIANR